MEHESLRKPQEERFLWEGMLVRVVYGRENAPETRLEKAWRKENER